jgi:hypothetical protein
MIAYGDWILFKTFLATFEKGYLAGNKPIILTIKIEVIYIQVLLMNEMKIFFNTVLYEKISLLKRRPQKLME